MLWGGQEPVFRPTIPPSISGRAAAFVATPRHLPFFGRYSSFSRGSITPYSLSLSASANGPFTPTSSLAFCAGLNSDSKLTAGTDTGKTSRFIRQRSGSGHHSSSVSSRETRLNGAATRTASEKEAFFVGMSAPDVGTGASSPTATSSAGDGKRAGFPPVTMDPDATQKFAEIVVRWDDEGEEESVIIRGLKAAEYHKDAAAPTMQQLEEAGVQAWITGGGRIKHDSSDKSIFIFGYSMQFGPADLARVAEMCRVAYPDYDISFNKGGY